MAKVAIVSYDVQTIRGEAGGVAALCTRWATLLREAGDDVTIVMTRTDWEPMSVDPPWKARYQALGIGLIELQSPPPSPTRWPEVPTMRISELAAPVLRNFDIVYFQDWGNTAFHLVRERRFAPDLGPDQGPIVVTGVHGPSEWQQSSNEKFPELPGGLHLAYQERYAAQHSDFVMSSGNYMVDTLTRLGWKFPGPIPLVGLPMPASFQAGTAKPIQKIRSVVYFGRLEERKGIRIFVQAMQYFAKELTDRPEVILFGSVMEQSLLDQALKTLRTSGFTVTHKMSVDSETSTRWLRDNADHILCVVPSPSDNHPYTIVEASLIPGLNLIACNSGGVPEMLHHAEGQLSAPIGRDLGGKIVERYLKPLTDSELAHYDWRGANERWLAFHRMALASRETRVARTLPEQHATVDVIVTYYQKAPYLPQLVDALERQTEQDFHVIAVNDGSPDDESNRVFEEQTARVAGRNWDFYRQENAFVDAARNSAVRRGTGEFLLFVDADDVPSLNAVARMREALTLSGDDALICASYLFASDKMPYNLATGEITVPPYATCIPLGINLVGGLLDPSSFGGSMFIIRRSVYEALGGFRELRGAGHEDWELYVRVALAGYKIDVLPEMLQFYRQVEGSLARTLSPLASKRRLIDAYEESMAAVGLRGGALALAGLYQKSKEMEARVHALSAQIDAPQEGYTFFSGANKRFETNPDGVGLGRLQSFYREKVSLETRLKLHRILFSRFVGEYKPPSA